MGVTIQVNTSSLLFCVTREFIDTNNSCQHKVNGSYNSSQHKFFAILCDKRIYRCKYIPQLVSQGYTDII